MRLLADRDFRYTLRPSLQPLVLPACALVAGIAAGPRTGLGAGVWTVAALAFTSAALVVRRRPVAALVLALAATASAGAWREGVVREAARARPLARLVDGEAIRAGETIALRGKLVAPPDLRPGRARLVVRVERVASASLGERDVEGRATVSVGLSKPGAAEAWRALGLSYGAPVLVRATVSDDLAFRNPGVEPIRSRYKSVVSQEASLRV